MLNRFEDEVIVPSDVKDGPRGSRGRQGHHGLAT